MRLTIRLHLIIFFGLLYSIAPAQITSFPYLEDFSTLPGNWVIGTSGGTSWEIGVPTAPGTNGAYSAPNCAGTDLDSGYRAGTNTYLESPRFNISALSNPLFTFYQFRYMSTGLDGMHVEFSTDDITWFMLGTIGSPGSFNWYNSSSVFATGQPGFTGNSGGWVQSGYYLGGVTSGLIRFRFVFRSNISFGSAQAGVFIDNIKIEDSTTPVADIWASTNPGFSAPFTSGVKTALFLRISNFSSVTTVDSAHLGYLLNNSIQLYDYRAINLAPGTTDTIFIDSVLLPPGYFSLKTFIEFTGDPNHNNDTVLNGGLATAFSTVPYSDNFDQGNTGWYEQSFGLTHWELGYPNFGATTGAYSGNNAWDINLNSGYSGNADATLYSPTFDLTTLNAAELKFWQNRNAEAGWDGMRIDYSVDGGLNWLILGYQGDPMGTNWYTSNAINSTNYPAWEGNSFGWTQSRYKLNAFSNATQFCLRFVFNSDGAINKDGISIDNFVIDAIPDYDAAYISLNNNYLNTAAGQNTGNIQIKLTNVGALPISNFTAGYSINGITQQSQAFNQILNPNDTVIVTLPGFVAPSGIFPICGFITLANDADTSNNSGCFQATGVSLLSIPYSDDFETGSPGWTTNNVNPTSQWQLGLPNYGYTNSAHSGVNCWDINLNTAYFDNAICYLTSPPFDLTTAGPSRLSFWINSNSEAGWDGTRTEISTDGGANWSLLGYVGDPNSTNWYNDVQLNSSSMPGWCDNSNGWKKSTYRLDSYASATNFKIRFVFTSDQSIQTDGFSIDDFAIEEIPDFDAEITAIRPISMYPPVGVNCGNIALSITNVGSQPFSNVSYGYSVNGVPVQAGTYSSTIQPMDTVIVVLPGFVPAAGIASLCGYVHLNNDTNTVNDTICTSIEGKPVYSPYFQDDFDGNNLGWSTSTPGNPLTTWQWGTPNYGQTNSAYSFPGCWDINLSTAYTESANTTLISPWFDLSTSVDPILTFMQNRNTELYNGGFYVQWTTNGSSAWNTLGTFNDPTGINWYTQALTATFPNGFWDGSSNGWIKSEYPLSGVVPVNSLIQFRFVFLSANFNLVSDGVSIDDFKIEVALANDAELKSIVSPGPVAIENSATPVQVLLRNNGSIQLTSLDLKYVLNGGAPVSSTWNGFLLHDSTTIVTLPSILPTAGLNTLRVYVNWGGDLNQMNDTLDYTFNAIATSGIPYFNDFEAGPGFWTSNSTSTTKWEFGTPAFGTTNTAYSGDSCWDINLNTPYGNLANATLTSPIFDLGIYNIVTISFWQNYTTEQNADGMLVEYSTNGTVWQALGTQGDPNGTNWYNSTIYQSNQAWSGNSGGWINSSYVYYKPWGSNYFQMRFKFLSDFNLVNFGVSIDDVSISGVVGTEEISGDQSLHVYPNPANELLHIQSSDLSTSSIRIYLPDGRTVIEQPVQDGHRFTIDISQLADGYYLMEATDRNGIQKTVKFAVKH